MSGCEASNEWMFRVKGQARDQAPKRQSHNHKGAFHHTKYQTCLPEHTSCRISLLLR